MIFFCYRLRALCRGSPFLGFLKASKMVLIPFWARFWLFFVRCAFWRLLLALIDPLHYFSGREIVLVMFFCIDAIVIPRGFDSFDYIWGVLLLRFFASLVADPIPSSEAPNSLNTFFLSNLELLIGQGYRSFYSIVRFSSYRSFLLFYPRQPPRCPQLLDAKLLWAICLPWFCLFYLLWHIRSDLEL